MSDYLADLRRALSASSLSKQEAEQVLADVANLLAAGVPESDLGSPEDFVANLSDSETPHYTSFHAGSQADRERAYDPQSRLLVPRILGIGADLNIGALAVKLGLLRPDDVDDDVINAIPPQVMTAVKALPVSLGVLAFVSAVTAYRKGLPIPSSVSVTGQVKKFAGLKTGTLAVSIASLGFSGWALSPTTGVDKLARPSLASFVTTLLAGSAVSAHTVVNNKVPMYVTASPLVAGVATQLATFVIPIKRGLAHITDQ